ncbi:MAG: FeoB-associated Cys-rich membrane protein [Oscillospiraceae bacterium]|nr:FeoB-associated Cys-rich membrane protein [Oscillospiraceae bacterium]
MSIGTIIVGFVLFAVVALTIAKMIKDKKKGKSSCSCSCGSCPYSGQCHSKKK